jgi:hypothetical protein
MLADAIAHAGQPAGDLGDDLDRGELLAAMGVPAALGPDADTILALVAATEAGARSQQTFPTDYGRTSLAAPNVHPAAPELVLAAFKKFPGPSSEFRTFMAGGVQVIGYQGPDTYHEDLGIDSNTQTAGTLSATTQMHTVVDVVLSGSDVKTRFDTDIHNSVTDTKTGYTTFTETTRQSMAGELDACPNAAGLVPASLEITNDEDATTLAGADGQGGSRATGHSQSTSKFRGTVDDTATLGPVSQDYSHDEKFKQTGGPAPKEGSMEFGLSGIGDGVPAATGNDSNGATFGDWSGTTQTKAELSGDATSALIDRLPFDAGYAWATMQTSYSEAQKVWRDTRCVIVTAPDYIAASEFDFNAKPTHTEDVDKGSTTAFQIGLDHRYKQAVTAKVTAKLDGKESVSPELIEKPPGQLTYVAPDSDGNDATVLLESVSRQGIGRLRLTFHTGTVKIRVSINGTMTTSGFGVSYTTTLHVSNILLTRTADPPECSKDGISCKHTFAGSGQATAEVLLQIADCRKPYVEKGVFRLKAKRELFKENANPPRWQIIWDPATTMAFNGGACAGASIESFVGTGDAGPISGFMFVLGDLNFGAQGGETRVRRTVTLGNVFPATNVIDATVKAEVISETGP